MLFNFTAMFHVPAMFLAMSVFPTELTQSKLFEQSRLAQKLGLARAPLFEGARLRAHMFGRGLRFAVGVALRWIAFFALAFSLVAVPQAGQAQGVVKAKHGDWQVRCETPPGASKQLCALVQSIAAEDRPNIGLVIIVLKTADGKNRLLRVIAPLGVLLPSGLGLKVDDTDIGHAGFVRCQPSGCIAEVVMEDKLLDQLKNGKNAVFIIFQTPEEGIGIPLALNGFKEAFAELP